jgi:predicted ATPase
MRIAFSGPQNSGKTTLVNNFLHVWSNYTTPKKTYRDIITEKGLQHSSQTTTDTQWEVLNFMVDQLQQYDKKSKVVFDRCPLDNLVYTLWAFEKGLEGFDKKFVDKCISITKESMRHLDIIFLTRYDKSIPIEDDGMRDTNSVYIEEIDNIFNAMRLQYEVNYDADIFFPKDDSPGVIELPTSPQRRIDLISEYLDPDGEIFGEEHSILNPNNLKEMESLVQQQKLAMEQEEKERELYKKFGLGDFKL